MLRKELRIMAGTVCAGKLYFSSSNYNGLFVYNLNSETIELLGVFEREEEENFVLHRECCVCGKWLAFIPQNGGIIDFYNVESEEMKRVQVVEKDAVKAIATAEYFREKLYIFPLYKKNKPLIVDMKTFEVTENVTILNFVQKESIRESLSTELIFTRSYIKDSVIYAGLYNTNKYLAYDILKNEIQTYTSKIKDIFCVQRGKEGIWVIGVAGDIEFIGENSESIIYSTPKENILPGQWAYNRLLDIDGTGIVLPAYADNILKLSDGEVKIMQYPKVFKVELNPEWIKFFGGVASGSKAYLYPYTHRHMLVVEEEIIRATVVDFDKTECLLDKNSAKFFKEDLKKRASYSGGILVESKEQYDLNDYVKIV